MVYPELKLDENGRAKICPNCGNEEMLENTEYCKICGKNLINRCTNISGYDTYDGRVEPCGKITSGNARYCEYCGQPTTFYQQNFLKDWDGDKSEDPPF